MTKEMEARKNWRFRWLNLIFEFSHLEFQKGLWFDHKYPNEIGWFGEDVCQYFDDLHIDNNYEYQLENEIISPEEYQTIKNLHFELDKFVKMTNKMGDAFNEKQILKNKEWLAVCEIGKTAWDVLKSVIIDPNEKKHMNGLEKSYLYVKE